MKKLALITMALIAFLVLPVIAADTSPKVDTVAINGSFRHSVKVDFPQRDYIITWYSPEEELKKSIAINYRDEEDQSLSVYIMNQTKTSDYISLVFEINNHKNARSKYEDLSTYYWSNWDNPNKTHKPEKATIAGRDGLIVYQEMLKTWAGKLFIDQYAEMGIWSEMEFTSLRDNIWDEDSFKRMLKTMTIEVKTSK